jgi:RND family efflux transporter MFP subunit
VTQRLAEVGQVLSAGQGVVTVARPDVREAVVDIPEAHVGALPSDGVFTVALQSAPELTARGRVREIAPLAESGTRSKRIRITLDDPGPAFRLGATINVSLMRKVAPTVLLPASALLEDGDRRSVWVVSPDGTAVARRDVTVTARDNAEDGRVAVAGVHVIKEGQAVRLTDGAV